MIGLNPLIGITTYYVSHRELGPSFIRGRAGQDMMMSTLDYSRCIEEAGGIPVAIPVINQIDYIKQISQQLDGFLFTGGLDISPLRYGKNISRNLGNVVPERDEFELSLLDYVLKFNKSVFGICRGFQLLNVFFGGTLCQDAWDSGFQDIEHFALMYPKTYPVHQITIKENSFVERAFNKRKLWVNSLHHQIIETLGEGLEISAWADDGVVEAFEHRNYSHVAGVQWHPEMMAELYTEQLALFKTFVDSIKKRSTVNDSAYT